MSPVIEKGGSSVDSSGELGPFTFSIGRIFTRWLLGAGVAAHPCEACIDDLAGFLLRN